MNEIRPFTIRELAEDAFSKGEIVKNLLMLNTPQDYEARKKAFIELAVARHQAKEAEAKLADAIERR